MEKAELVFIPAPGAGHLVSTVEIAKLLVAQDHCLSNSVLLLDPNVTPPSSVTCGVLLTYSSAVIGSF